MNPNTRRLFRIKKALNTTERLEFKEVLKMDKLLEILRGVNPDVDFTKEKDLFGSHILDSLSLVMLIPDLEETFDIEITPADLLPENFESAETIYAMITRLQENG